MDDGIILLCASITFLGIYISHAVFEDRCHIQHINIYVLKIKQSVPTTQEIALINGVPIDIINVVSIL